MFEFSYKGYLMLNNFAKTLLLMCISISAYPYTYPIVTITRMYHSTPTTTTVEFTQELVEIDGTDWGTGKGRPTLGLALSNNPTSNYLGEVISIVKGGNADRKTYSAHAMWLYSNEGGSSKNSITYDTPKLNKYPRYIVYGVDYSQDNPNASHFTWPPGIREYYDDNVPDPIQNLCFFTQDSLTIDHNTLPNTQGVNTATNIVGIECSDPMTLRVSINPKIIKLGEGVESSVFTPVGDVFQVNQGYNPMVIASELTVSKGAKPGVYNGSTIVTINIE